MTQEIKSILEQLSDHEARLVRLEGMRVTPTDSSPVPASKQQTLRELVKGRKFKNGQEQLAVIVGYYEVIIKKPVNREALKSEWLAAKMLNKYDGKFLERAKDVLFRIDSDGACILTQTGEDFFEKFQKNESSGATLK